MSFLSLIPLKAWLIAGGVAAFGFVLWHDHWMSGRYKAAHAEVVQVKATLIAEQESRKHERELNAKIDQQLLDANKALDVERAKPLPRLQCRRVPVSAGSLPGSTTASASDPTATEGHDGQADAGDFDPSADLLQYAVDAEENRNTLAACQEWVRAK